MFNSWKSVAIAVAVIFAFAGLAEGARRIDRDGVLFAGHDGVDQQIVSVNSSGAALTNAQGPAADDAAASGNPVPVGGIYNTTLPTYTNLDRTQAQFGSRGALNVTLWPADGATAVNAAGTTGDGISASVQKLSVGSFGRTFNGSTWDQTRSVINATDSTGTGIAAAGLLAQCDETSPTATTENQFGNLTRNCATGALKVERDGDLFLNIVLAAPTTTTVKSGAGRFHKLCINKAAANGVITIYDNTAASGTLIATITQPAALLSSGINCAEYDLAFGTGLTIVTATAAQDITVTYR